MGSKKPEDAWSGWTPKEVKKHRVAIYQLADGTYEAFTQISKIPPDAVRVDPQPAFPTSGNPHEGTRVAMKKLQSSHPTEIAWGCHVAIKIAKRRLTVHSRDVWDELGRMGIVSASSGSAFWLGAVFDELKRAGLLKPTGQTLTYSDASRGIHERTIKIWGLTEDADTSAYDKEPATRPT